MLKLQSLRPWLRGEALNGAWIPEERAVFFLLFYSLQLVRPIVEGGLWEPSHHFFFFLFWLCRLLVVVCGLL